MNEKDYKNIAEIIKNVQIKKEFGGDFENQDETKKLIAEELADYFDKEAKKNRWEINNKGDFKKVVFDKKQFLKDCGVE